MFRFARWARQLFTPLPDPFGPTEIIEPQDVKDQLIYRLKRWPRFPSSRMNTDVSRALSVMSMRPVNRRWLMNNSNLRGAEVDSMLQRLVEQDAVDVTDVGKYRPPPHAV